MFIYIKSEPNLWTTGFYKPDGSWYPESDWPTPGEAAQRTAYLNGAPNEKWVQTVEECIQSLKQQIITFQIDLSKIKISQGRQ